MKKKILIATLNDYIVYQPTILNLYDRLKAAFDVEVISFEPDFISKKRDTTRNIRYLSVSPIRKELAQKFDFLVYKVSPLLTKIFPGFKYHYRYYNKVLPSVFRKALLGMKADHVIAVDIPALAICQEVFGAVHFLSLEIDKEDPFLKRVDVTKIRSVFIQNRNRLEYLLPLFDGKVFIVQNAPPYVTNDPLPKAKKDFIWAGTMVEKFGILDCIRFFKEYPQYKLVLKGGADKKTMQKIQVEFSDLINKGIVEINDEYLPGEQFIEFLSGFRIGFCFYSWNLIQSNYNYSTAPSGKLFMYMAAGVPVIACDIPGFDFVKSFGAGVLVKDYQPETILEAIKVIEADYESFQQACKKVAVHFDFNSNVSPYLEFLKGEGS